MAVLKRLLLPSIALSSLLLTSACSYGITRVDVSRNDSGEITDISVEDGKERAAATLYVNLTTGEAYYTAKSVAAFEGQRAVGKTTSDSIGSLSGGFARNLFNIP